MQQANKHKVKQKKKSNTSKQKAKQTTQNMMWAGGGKEARESVMGEKRKQDIKLVRKETRKKNARK